MKTAEGASCSDQNPRTEARGSMVTADALIRQVRFPTCSQGPEPTVPVCFYTGSGLNQGSPG